MRIKNIKETEIESYKLVKFNSEELEGDYVDLIGKLIERESIEGKNCAFYTNLSKGGVQLKNKIVDEIDGVLETGFVKRKNGKVYFKVITNK